MTSRAFGSWVHLLHVTETPAAEGWASIVSGADVDRSTADSHTDVLGQLTFFAVDWSRNDRRPHGARPDVLAVRAAFDPSTAIMAYAREKGCDLIVMGTHPGSALPTLLRGGTAERVRRSANCPVVLVPPAEAEGRQAYVPAGDEFGALVALAS
jgi:nucleotide-binding universal stress UspA family protein